MATYTELSTIISLGDAAKMHALLDMQETIEAVQAMEMKRK